MSCSASIVPVQPDLRALGGGLSHLHGISGSDAGKESNYLHEEKCCYSSLDEEQDLAWFYEHGRSCPVLLVAQ